MAKTSFDPRKLMQQAIGAMRQTVHEPRNDGKASPKVGTVLYRPYDAPETAYRGELRYGDHAEYTILERKNRDQKLDDSILFSTLEPCAPGSRHHPKISCAERIFLARIKEVWVGIEDPDPTVDRKGIKFLQDNGVTVHMFDRDLQEVIHKENKEFIAQAMERADENRIRKAKSIVLSPLENKFRNTALNDFSTEALEQYRSFARIKDPVDSSAFKHRLIHQGLLKHEDESLVPTGFGILLFGREPRTILLQAGLLATILYPDGKEELKDFDGPMVLIPGLVENWLRDKLPNVIDRNSMRRKEIQSLPFDMIREAVVNALIHRDYSYRGGKCQLIITVDTITIKSPGEPLPPITLEQLQTFNAPMLSRNPELHYVFATMEMAEERGFGIKSLKMSAEKVGLPLPRYTWDEPYLVLTLFRSIFGAERSLEPEILASLNKTERLGWQLLSTKDTITSREYASEMGIPSRTALNHLKRFTLLGLLRRVGAGPSTKYEVLSPQSQ